MIPSQVPSLIDMPAGCRFASRCQARIEHDLDICTEQIPELIEISPGHRVRYWLHPEAGDTTNTGVVETPVEVTER